MFELHTTMNTYTVLAVLIAVVSAVQVNALDEDVSPERVISLKKEMDSLQSQMMNLQPAPQVSNKKQVFYGFTAFANTEVEYDQGNTIQFQETVTNIGDDFNTGTGIFTCPITGHYFFVVHIYNSSGRDIGVSIVKGSEVLTKAYINTGQTQYRKSSTSVAQQCNQGEQVFVQCSDSGDLEGNSNRETTFSGFLITET